MTPLDDLRSRRLANLDELVQLMGVQLGHDLSRGTPPDLRAELEEQVEHAYEQWGEDHALGAEPSCIPLDLQRLFLARRDIDLMIARLGGGEDDAGS